MLRRLTALCTGILAWFADAGLRPRTRIELNCNEAMKSLVAAGDGAAVLPRPPDAWDGAPRHLLLTLAQFRPI